MELVHLIQHEQGLEALRQCCEMLLRHGNWGIRAALVGMHPNNRLDN